MHRRRVSIQDRTLPVTRTSRQYFKMLNFTINGRQYVAIEQNAAKPSYWGQLARQGHEVVQFKDIATGRFVAVAVDGTVKEHRRWRLPVLRSFPTALILRDRALGAGVKGSSA